MDRTETKTDRRSQIAMSSFFALTAFLALTAVLTAKDAQTNLPLRATVLGLVN